VGRLLLIHLPPFEPDVGELLLEAQRGMPDSLLAAAGEILATVLR
jgi:hypothetical protein